MHAGLCSIPIIICDIFSGNQQLRRTDTQKVPKPYQMPARSLSMQCLTSTTDTYLKTDLIAELKISKDIPGIKKMKVEQQMANRMDSEHYMEITKQFTANNYVDQVSAERLNMIMRMREEWDCNACQRSTCRYRKRIRPAMPYPTGSDR